MSGNIDNLRSHIGGMLGKGKLTSGKKKQSASVTKVKKDWKKSKY